MGYVITPNGNIVKFNEKINQQFQKGGYEIQPNGLVTKRLLDTETEGPNKRLRLNKPSKRLQEANFKPNKRQRLLEDTELEDIDFYNEEMFELVNIEYIITYKTTYDGDETRYHRAKGFLRNVNKMCVDMEIDEMTEHYCTVSLYPTSVESKTIKTSPIPTQVNDLVHERMFGVALQYNFLPVEPNDSNTKECVYQYLLSRYGAYLKTLTKAKLMKIFGEDDSTKGVSTAQIIKFCKKHNVK